MRLTASSASGAVTTRCVMPRTNNVKFAIKLHPLIKKQMITCAVYGMASFLLFYKKRAKAEVSGERPDELR
jgi:hypothetical protein